MLSSPRALLLMITVSQARALRMPRMTPALSSCHWATLKTWLAGIRHRVMWGRSLSSVFAFVQNVNIPTYYARID
jgi:hypothetical protein